MEGKKVRFDLLGVEEGGMLSITKTFAHFSLS